MQNLYEAIKIHTSQSYSPRCRQPRKKIQQTNRRTQKEDLDKMIPILWDILYEYLRDVEPVTCQVTLNNDVILEFRCDETTYSTNDRIAILKHDNITSYFYIDDIILLSFKKDKQPVTLEDLEKGE